MKELSIEEKAKAYDELFVKAQQIYNKENDVLILHTIEELFPELKDEDERIRKALIEYFNEQCNMSDWNGIYGYQVVAWLEKQGEKIDAIENFDTEFEKQVSCFIASAMNKEHEYNQGYVKWVANALFNYAKHELEKQGEQNTAWSEEDEKRLQSCLNVLQPRGIMGVTETINTKWLKSLKNRVQPKQEWSSKEDAFVQVCINAINGISYFSSEQKEIVIDWLKSLRPQNTWKPTELQMDVLLDEANAWTKGCPKQKVLESLYNDLKKLREE